MLLQVKVYLLSIMYLFGAVFMVLFPPRNFCQSGAKMRTVRSLGSNLKYDRYVSYQSLKEEAQRIAREDKELAKVIYMNPTTYENRTLVGLTLLSDMHSSKPGILVIGGKVAVFAFVSKAQLLLKLALNGEVWGASNAILELADKLLYDTNYQTPFFNDYNWYLVPMPNPDGLHFTQKLRTFTKIDSLLWSKNMTARYLTCPNSWRKNVDMESDKDDCFGTNVNRNFAYHWQDDVRKTPERCSQYYPGARPFSTSEARAIREYLRVNGEFIHLAIHLDASPHPKKEYILYPWRYTNRQPSNYGTLQDIGEYTARQTRMPDGRLYEVRQSSHESRRVAGTLSDYLSGVVGVELVYLVRPYHQLYPNYTDTSVLEAYVKKAVSTILNLVRGWRRSTRQNTLSFFGRDVEF